MGYFSDLNLRRMEARYEEEWEAGWFQRQVNAAKADRKAYEQEKAAAEKAVWYEVYSAQPGQQDSYRARYVNLSDAQDHCRAIEDRLPADGFTYIVEVQS